LERFFLYIYILWKIVTFRRVVLNTVDFKNAKRFLRFKVWRWPVYCHSNSPPLTRLSKLPKKNWTRIQSWSQKKKRKLFILFKCFFLVVYLVKIHQNTWLIRYSNFKHSIDKKHVIECIDKVHKLYLKNPKHPISVNISVYFLWFLTFYRNLKFKYVLI